MKHNELKKEIGKQKAAIKHTEKNIIMLLGSNSHAAMKFKTAIADLQKDRKTVHGMGAADDDTPWYENSFITKLMDVGTTQLTAKNNQKELELQLNTVAQQNAALDKQLSLQSRLQSAGAYGGSFIDELMASPTKLALIAGLGFAFFKMRGKK